MHKLIFLTAVALVAAVAASGPSPAFAKAAKQTDKASPTLSRASTAPRDPATGLPTGKRMHKPFTITREAR
jgi:hypothetical protein